MRDSRVFLGWDEPCLPRAARWLRDRYSRDGTCDMGHCVIALPGARAGRRLLELLAEPGGVLIPPSIITVGAIPQLLYESNPVDSESDTAMRLASPLEQILARVMTLRTASASTLEPIVPHPPKSDDLLGWLSLARDIAKLHEELAGEGLQISEVIERCQKQPDFNDEARWEALEQLQEAYEKALAERGLQDEHAARIAALQEQRCATDKDIILIALTDMPRIIRQMLAQVAGRVTPLIHAPASEADGFDPLGCLIVEPWCNRVIDVPDELIHIVDRPNDQAMQMLQQIGSPAESTTADGGHADATCAGRFTADEITIGVGDDKMLGMLHRTLDLAGLPAHAATGKPLIQSRPAVLLDSLARFTRSQRLDDFASLLRHADVELFLTSKLSQPEGDVDAAQTTSDEVSATIAHWITLLDAYITEHLQSRSIGQWLGDENQTARLKQIYDHVRNLLPEGHDQPAPLSHWGEPIAAILKQIYKELPLSTRIPADADLIHALQAIATVLREQAELDAADTITPRLPLVDAITFTLSRLADLSTPDAAEPGQPAIELLGWLELALDDAPALIITGFNEHLIPQSAGADAFLPNHMRQLLGLMDNQRRYARDAAALTTMLHSKHHLSLIAGRRGSDDEPLTPSRLLLAGDGLELSHRIMRFYPKDPAAAPASTLHPLLPVGGVNQFLIPAPVPPAQPLSVMSVTWLKTYLDCPYRFYLQYIRGLEAMDDQAIELDGMRFGTLAHDVLNLFGRSDVRDADDENVIAAFLNHHLDETAAAHLGTHPPIAARLQMMQLQQRFAAFAREQAQLVREGWRILPQHVECGASTIFEMEDGNVTIKGRIDRIDKHTDGRHRIIDYKTGDNGKTPEQIHRQGPKDAKTWSDLQLPIYHRLAASLDITGDIELGYMLLPKKLEETGFAIAEWDEATIADGIATAEQVIAKIRAGIFWPPRDRAPFADDFSAICMEDHPRRAMILNEVERKMKEGA